MELDYEMILLKNVCLATNLQRQEVDQWFLGPGQGGGMRGDCK